LEIGSDFLLFALIGFILLIFGNFLLNINNF
jgi:hypothetical protein